MKALLKNSYVVMMLAGAVLGGCEKPENVVPEDRVKAELLSKIPDDSGFDVKLFAGNLKKSFDGNTVGYAFAIAQNGQVVQEVSGGLARMPKDGKLPYLTTTRQGTSYGTQTITALAILKALEKKGLNENAYVWEFLPASWNVPYANRKITFAHLLMHKSGLKYAGSGLLSLKHAMQTHTMGCGDADIYYKHDPVNYFLCRILLSSIVNGKEVFEGPWQEVEDEVAYFYRDYVRGHIFKVAGLPDWNRIEPGDWNENGPINYYESPGNPYNRNTTLYYNFSNPSFSGITAYTVYKSAGPGQWYVTPAEIVSALMIGENNKVVSPAMLQRMKNKLMGFDARIKGRHGSYYWKKGHFTDLSQRGYETVTMHFPNNVQVAWNTNSRSNKLGDPEDVILAAYENAWKY